MGNTMPVKTSRSYLQIISENVFTPINNILFALGLALVMLGKVSDAVISVGVVMLNVAVSVAQEVQAKRTLDQIALLTRPTTIVLRDGQERSVDPGNIVVGDVLLVRAGDQIVVDGPVLATDRVDVDESLLTGESDLITKKNGDELFSGSFCVNGSAFYQAEKVGAQSVAYGLTAGARAFRRVYTPLQREINLVIRVILLLALFFELLLVLNVIVNDIPLVGFLRMSVVVIGIVPKGLFLAISVAYALGAVRIAGQGALVQQSNAVESLSHVDVLCMDKTGTLTANALQLANLHPLAVDEAELRRLLGVFVASGSAGNMTSRAIGEACPAQARHPEEEIPFSSALKWSALSFADVDLRGVYVLGAVEMLEPSLRPGSDIASFVKTESEQGLRVLLFATFPDPVPLRNSEDQPVLPADLVPLGLVSLRDQLRAEARETLAQFMQAGIQLKIISGDNPQTVAALAKQAGVSDDVSVVSGLELAAMDDAQFAQAAYHGTIFGRITPQQKERLVQTLRQQGRYVAMIGDGVNDVLSLKKANLGVAMQSGSSAARNVADIVLLNDSFASLPPAFREGQRIRNGMQNILKLFLTRVLYVALLLISTLVAGGFPFVPKQISILTLLTVGIPTLALAAWARPGVTEGRSMLRSLFHFVIPAAITLGLMALFVYLGEYMLFLVEQLAAQPDINIEQLSAPAQAAAQSGLTTFTMFCGILLILFVEPPTKFWVGGEELKGDRRIIWLALAMFLVYMGLLLIPPLRNLFELSALDLVDYVTIVSMVGLWTMLVRWCWRVRLLQRFL